MGLPAFCCLSHLGVLGPEHTPRLNRKLDVPTFVTVSKLLV